MKKFFVFAAVLSIGLLIGANASAWHFPTFCELNPEVCSPTSSFLDSIDSDGDGVVESADECVSEAGPVETNGCPDADADGVKDSADLCAETAADATVNENGCPDTDLDGIYDDADACIDEAADTSDGCPVAPLDPIITGDRIVDDEATGDETTGPEASGEAWGGGCSMAGNVSHANILSVVVLALSLVPMTIRRRK